VLVFKGVNVLKEDLELTRVLGAIEALEASSSLEVCIYTSVSEN